MHFVMRLRIFLSVLTGVGVMNKTAAYQIFSLSTSYLSPHFRWYFEGRKCEEPGQPWRLLSLHTAARQGQFCCRSGQCIRSVKRQFSSKINLDCENFYEHNHPFWRLNEPIQSFLPVQCKFIRSSLRCDNSIDCVDESDEENCKLILKSTYYKKDKVIHSNLVRNDY